MSENNVKISIIMPAYNAENYLQETLESVFDQNFDSYELIIINDGSTDNTQKIIDEYAEKYKGKLFAYEQKNQGQSATRNRALEYVSGEYIAFVDADDILEKDYLKTLYNACQERHADMAIGGYKKFVTGSTEIVYSRNAADWDVEFENGIHHVFQYSPCGKLYSSQYIKSHNFKFSEGEQLEGGPYGVMTHIVADEVVVLDYQGYLYRIHNESTMGNVRKKLARPKVPYKGIEDAIQQVRRYKKEEAVDKVLEYCIVKVLAGLTTNMYKSCDTETRKEICKYCYYILKKYFPNVEKNPYIGIFKLKKIPFVHRMAVQLFVIAYKMHMLYPFSLLVSKML